MLFFRRIQLTAPLVAASICHHAAAAEDLPGSSKPVFNAVSIGREIHLTGQLNDPLWQRSDPIELPYEVIPSENTPASERTFVRVLYDADKVYLGFDCRDSHPQEIRAHISDRDKLYDDDFVILMLDTYGDDQRAYEFLVNPYGIQADVMMSGGNEDDSFDTLWESAAVRSDSGWTAEMAIPFKSIRFPSAAEQRWSIVLARNFPRASRVIFSWTPYDRNNPCLMCQGGWLAGIRGVESTTSVEFLPYVVGQQRGALNDEEDAASGFSSGKVQGRVGCGVRYAPTPDLSIEAVVNPDFSQVESDADQIDVNTRFALSYPEKRPFFQLAADVFQNRTGIYYSRSINDPSAAAKLVGKSGALSYAYLAASDRNTPVIVPGAEESDVVETARLSYSNIARLRYDVGQETFIGGMVSTRNAGSAHNYVGGIDWNYLFWSNYYLRGEAFFSATRELNDLSLFDDPRALGRTGHTAAFDGEGLAGAAYRLSLSRSARDYNFFLGYEDISPAFQAQNGFVGRCDRRFLSLEQKYVVYPRSRLMDECGVLINSTIGYDYSGIRKELWTVVGGYALFTGQIEVVAGYLLLNDERYGGVLFREVRRPLLEIHAKPSGALTLSLNGEFGRFINRDDPPSLGTGHELRSTLTVRPTSQLRLEFSYARARLVSVKTKELLYDGNITRALAVYQFTPEIFLRTIAQYNSFDKVFSIYPLLSYKLNPFTIFYTGVTQDEQKFGGHYGFVTAARQFFVKLQYLWRS